MNKTSKGFTLTELIAMLVILGIVTLLSFSTMTSTLKKTDIKNRERFNNNLIMACQTYVETNLDSIGLNEPDDIYTVSASFLLSDGYLSNQVVIPDEDKRLSDYNVIVKKNTDNTLSYEVIVDE